MQFARELETNVRSTDMVGRWDLDEFVVVLACDLEGAKTHLERIQKWVFGKYTIQTGAKDTRDVQIGASIGLAGWHDGKDLQQVIKDADAAMYTQRETGIAQAKWLGRVGPGEWRAAQLRIRS